MGDFNGRIGQIIHAFEKYPAGDLNTRMIVRETLAAERADGFKQGYGEGIHDASAADMAERQRARAAAEDEPHWYDNWTESGRDGDGNLMLRYEPTGGLYRVLPVEEG